MSVSEPLLAVFDRLVFVVVLASYLKADAVDTSPKTNTGDANPDPEYPALPGKAFEHMLKMTRVPSLPKKEDYEKGEADPGYVWAKDKYTKDLNNPDEWINSMGALTNDVIDVVRSSSEATDAEIAEVMRLADGSPGANRIKYSYNKLKDRAENWVATSDEVYQGAKKLRDESANALELVMKAHEELSALAKGLHITALKMHPHDLYQLNDEGAKTVHADGRTYVDAAGCNHADWNRARHNAGWSLYGKGYSFLKPLGAEEWKFVQFKRVPPEVKSETDANKVLLNPVDERKDPMVDCELEIPREYVEMVEDPKIMNMFKNTTVFHNFLDTMMSKGEISKADRDKYEKDVAAQMQSDMSPKAQQKFIASYLHNLFNLKKELPLKLFSDFNLQGWYEVELNWLKEYARMFLSDGMGVARAQGHNVADSLRNLHQQNLESQKTAPGEFRSVNGQIGGPSRV